MSSVLIGVFDNFSQARVAHAKIAATGIDPSAINLSGGDGYVGRERRVGP